MKAIGMPESNSTDYFTGQRFQGPHAKAKSHKGRGMDDSTSESSSQLISPSVTSVLGVKGALRFRRHGARQKAHVVLRRVEIAEDSSYTPGRGPVAYFSLFAQKRIEVKPGKEILLAVASDDGSFTDQAVIFEGDLCTVSDSNSDEEEEVEKQIAHDDTFSDPPISHIIPPKMRRTWTKQHEQVSSAEGMYTPSPSYSPPIRAFGMSLLDNFSPSPPTHVSVGVQAQPTWSVSAVQVVPPAVLVQETLPLQTREPPGEPSTPVEEPVQLPEPDMSQKPTPPLDNRPIPHDDRSRSLSPMSIGSTPSTPPESPIHTSRPLPNEVSPSPTPTKPATAPRGKALPTASQQAPVAKPEPPWIHLEDAGSRTSQISPISSETVDMDLQSSPSSQSSAYPDDIPGFITGAASRRARPPSPLVLPVAPPKSGIAAQTPVPQSAQTIVASPASTVVASAALFTAESVTDKLEPPPTASKRAPIKNPFVSAGFITEFVGEKDTLTTRKDSTDHLRTSDKTPSPILRIKTEPTSHDSLPPPKSSPVPQPLRLKVLERDLPPHLSQSSTPSQYRKQPVIFSLPPRSSYPTLAHPCAPNTNPVKPGYQPVTSANDPRLSYVSTGSLSNPLNIRPSRHPPHPSNKPNARGSPPRQGPKKKVVVGSGWPYNRQTNGHATAGSAIGASPPVPKSSLPVVRPLTPESTRSSTTPPGLSGLAPYSSPSPPGFLHSSSGPKSTAPVDQGRFGLFSQSATSTPQIKHEINDWASPSLSQSPINTSGPNITIQAPRPIAPPSAASTVLQYTPQSLGQTGSNNSTPSRDSKGKKRALTSDADVDAENARPRKRAAAWPCHDPSYSVQVQSDDDPGISYLSFSSDGQRLAVICNDRTIRIWNMSSKVETARLGQNSPVMAVAWMSDDMGVVSLGRDGVISKWTRTNQNHWQWAKLLDAGKEDSICFAYRRDRIAVAFPRIGVKVWIWIKGTWQPQRSILRQNVTSIQFVEDGEALIGGTSDGVLYANLLCFFDLV
ncbi:hypothetical protein JVT61DRAFT_2761 [Boletus reticuloceps]|uniref:Uncharacterized protein n=1 Tax=Boletus reticuloceps TaxID=495285 RepID=A0A8I2YN20_9AGAM|nr:hypothetical protein JVT61DRAFT_2761 [Boletus reticuloceps]